MLNDEESPDSVYNRSLNQHLLSPASLNLETEEVDMEDVEMVPAPMSSRHGCNSISLRLPAYLQ